MYVFTVRKVTKTHTLLMVKGGDQLASSMRALAHRTASIAPSTSQHLLLLAIRRGADRAGGTVEKKLKRNL